MPAFTGVVFAAGFLGLAALEGAALGLPGALRALAASDWVVNSITGAGAVLTSAFFVVAGFFAAGFAAGAVFDAEAVFVVLKTNDKAEIQEKIKEISSKE